MPKVTGQDVPPELQALYAAITSPKKVEQGPDGEVRLKKGKKAPKRRPPENLDLAAFKYLAQQVAEGRMLQPGTPQYAALVYEITQELSVGFVNPVYFRLCTVVSAVTLESIPTSIEDPDPPPYGYRTTANYPTRPTYPDGTITAQPPGYAGAKVDTLFKDTYLRWRKIAFTSKAIEEIGGEKKLIMRWAVRIDVSAGSRGSRPMLSLHIKGRICGADGSDLDSTTPPLVKKTSLYWRFKVPPSTPPYYNSYQVRNIVKPFGRFAKKSGAGLFTHYLLNASNRPMAGRGFNNNDNVTTTFDADPELWEIKPPCRPYALSDGNVWTYEDATGKLWDASLINPRADITILNWCRARMTLRLTDGIVTNDIVIDQHMSGNWNWHFDNAGFDGDGALPKTETVRVIDASCFGNQAILHIRRPVLSYLKGARGFLLLSITSPNTATIATIADTLQCNQVTTHILKSDYGQYGNQIDHWWLDAKTFWCWFNEADQIEQIQYDEFTFSPYPWESGYTEMRIYAGGVVKSFYHSDIVGVGAFQSNLDGFNEGGRYKGWTSRLAFLDRYKQNTRINPNWNTRFSAFNTQDYYLSKPQRTNEQNWPWGFVTLEPTIISNKSVRLELRIHRFFTDYIAPVSGFGNLPSYKLSDKYLGKIVSPGSVGSEVIHEIIDP